MFGIALAWGGQMMVESATLDEVVERTDVAVIVQLGTPAMEKVSIPVPGGPGKRCDPYDYGVWEATVVEVVLPPRAGPSLPVGERFTIWPASTGMLIDLERRACVDGTRKSPVVERYDGIAPPEGGQALVLLRWDAPWGWVETVGGSWLDPKDAPRLSKIERARGASPPDGLVELACRSDVECGPAPTACGGCPPCSPASGGVAHRVAARWAREQCEASRSQGTPNPACAPCPPAEEARRPLRVSCEQMRCVGTP